jgi:hypothetical protein
MAVDTGLNSVDVRRSRPSAVIAARGGFGTSATIRRCVVAAARISAKFGASDRLRTCVPIENEL